MLTIRTFGHFWSRELIEWGWQNKRGSLLATSKPGATTAVADFREQIGIYALFNINREIVYIGQTGSGDKRLWSRLRDHNRGALRDRWTNFSWFGFLDVSETGLELNEQPNLTESDASTTLTAQVEGNFSDALNEIEGVLIKLVEPRLNKRGPNWTGSKEYFQYDPYEAEPTNRELLDEIHLLAQKVSQL